VSAVFDGDEYQARFDRLAAQGTDVHGEAAFVDTLDPRPSRVLDAGCGTGRVAIELARRGLDVVGVDVDDGMLAVARRAAPELTWIEQDLATLDLGPETAPFDVAVMAGNVMIFVEPGTESDVVAHVARHLARPTGALVAGFQLKTGGYDLARYDADCAAAGLMLTERYATWDRQPFVAGPGADYAVSVHRARS
jgi:2-polyprenyl-3-methyl-5-hydroxy-6-metoxy-1,4-benzoquinol methylase